MPDLSETHATLRAHAIYAQGWSYFYTHPEQEWIWFRESGTFDPKYLIEKQESGAVWARKARATLFSLIGALPEELDPRP